MNAFHGVSLSGAICCLLFVVLLGGVISGAFAPIASVASAFLPEPQSIGKMLMPN